MARRPTTADAYGAIAEPLRRDILALLAGGEKSVGELADALELDQPQASKHLKVLKEVDLVTVRRAGRKRIYDLNPATLRPVRDWLTHVEAVWAARFERLDAYLDGIRDEPRDERPDEPPDEP